MKTNKIPKYPPVWFLKISNRFRHFLVRFARRFTAPNVTIIELVQNFYVARAIGVVAELNIAEHLKSGSKNIKDLANLSNSHEESLYRLLRMLVSQGIFIEKRNKVFEQNILSNTLINEPDSMRNMIIHQVNSINWKFFEELNNVVKTGENAAAKVIGMDIFDYLEANPEKNDTYNNAMNTTSLMLSYALVAEYNFKKTKCIVDIGGGQGVLLSIILNQNKHLTGKVFDLPHVVNGSKTIFEKYGVDERAELVSGSFFDFIPKGGDTYIMKSIIHFMSNEEGVNLLKMIKNVLPKNGKLLIVEPIIENHNRYSFAKLYDIQMMVGRSEGKERTHDEYKSLIEQAELKLNRVVHTAAPFSVIEVI